MIKELKATSYFYDMIIIESLNAYVNQRRPVGGFLTAVLEGDLFQAYGRADINNTMQMESIVRYIYNEVPNICYGSSEKVANWYKGRRDVN